MHNISEKIKTWLPWVSIEDKAQEQIKNLSEMPFIYKHVAIMPDCHYGMGATVGSVIATKAAIIPAAVGVDIGCGMIAVKTKLFRKDLPDDLKRIRVGIERRVPLGAGGRNQKMTTTADVRATKLKDSAIKQGIDADFYVKDWASTIGSLGSGNHFIELSTDENDQIWCVLHSGSRGIGNKMAMKHIKTAQKIMADYFIQLKDRDLAYFIEGTKEFQEYIRDLLWCQDFALANREEMMDRCMTELSYTLYNEPVHEAELEVERINCHHNFTQRESHMGQNVWVTRKGAIQMRNGQKGVIPGSMGTRSYIVSGLENVPSFHSAPHGAGRNFSRTEAVKRFTMDDFDREMAGVECRRDEKLLDEIPGAYKSIDEVMENAKELVRVESVLKQIVNVKGN
jgi:tRNA-splicing ligase RtcB